MTQHKNVHAALAAAQAEMGPVIKGAVNPHFKNKYADLADVVSVARVALNSHGISFHHEIICGETRDLMRTILTHGDSGTSIHCDVPLIVQQANMQGFKSATTYAKRIGIESVTGIAPSDDDDGNAAAAAAPKKPTSAQMKRELETLRHELSEAMTEISVDRLARQWAAKIRNENWPDEDGETSFPAEVKRMFAGRRKELEDMTPLEDAAQ